MKLSVGVIQQTPVLNVGPFPPCVMEIASGQMENVLTEVCSASAFLDDDSSSLSPVFLFRRRRLCRRRPVISPIVI